MTVIARLSDVLLRCRFAAEYAGLRAALAAVDRIPLRAAFTIARVAADAAYVLLPRRRRLAEDNIRLARIAAAAADVRRIGRGCFRSIVWSALEVSRAEAVVGGDPAGVPMDIPDELADLLRDPKKGLIVVSGHLGNWSMVALLLSRFKPVVGMAKNMRNPWTDRLIKERSARAGLRIAPSRTNDAGRFGEVLGAGEIFYILPDQHARQRVGMTVPFFGRDVSMHRSAAMLHLATRTPLCFAYCVRTAPGRLLLKASPPFVHRATGDRERDVRAVLERFTAFLEEAIRLYPDQYVWVHRRWRRLRADALPTG